MKKLRLRALTKDDEPFLWEAIYHAIFVPDGDESPPREIVHTPELALYVRNWGKHDDFGFLAMLDDQPVGAAWCRRWSGSDKGYGFVDEDTPELSISVLPRYRGRGAGKSLLSVTIEEARKRYSAISLSVSKLNPAMGTYERSGFVAVGANSGSITMLKEFK